MQRAACRSPTYSQSVRQEGRNPARRAHRRHHRPGRQRSQSGWPAEAGVAAAAPDQRVVDRTRRHGVQQSRPSRAGRPGAEGLVGRRRYRLIVERTVERHAARRRRQESTRSMPAARSRRSPRRAAGASGASASRRRTRSGKRGSAAAWRSTAAVFMLRPATALSSASIRATALSSGPRPSASRCEARPPHRAARCSSFRPTTRCMH